MPEGLSRMLDILGNAASPDEPVSNPVVKKTGISPTDVFRTDTMFAMPNAGQRREFFPCFLHEPVRPDGRIPGNGDSGNFRCSLLKGSESKGRFPGGFQGFCLSGSGWCRAGVCSTISVISDGLPSRTGKPFQRPVPLLT